MSCLKIRLDKEEELQRQFQVEPTQANLRAFTLLSVSYFFPEVTSHPEVVAIYTYFSFRNVKARRDGCRRSSTSDEFLEARDLSWIPKIRF